jgi:hypothetical protein
MEDSKDNKKVSVNALKIRIGADIINLMQASLREYVAAYNTLVSLQRTEDSTIRSKEDSDSIIVDNAAETLAAFELQSREFKYTQIDFEEYIKCLKEDIDRKAKKIEQEIEEYQYSENELNELDNEILKQILEEKGLKYDAENFAREQAIFDILESQGEFDNE